MSELSEITIGDTYTINAGTLNTGITISQVINQLQTTGISWSGLTTSSGAWGGSGPTGNPGYTNIEYKIYEKKRECSDIMFKVFDKILSTQFDFIKQLRDSDDFDNLIILEQILKNYE